MNPRTCRTASPRLVFWPHEGAAEFPVMPPDSAVDVAVVGAGIAGLTTAYLLAREGRRVAVVDPDGIGGGETGRAAARLSNVVEGGFARFETRHGTRLAQLVAASRGAAIEAVERIVAGEGLDADFERVDGYIFARSRQGAAGLDLELDAARRAGLDVERRRRSFEGVDLGPVLRVAGQARLHAPRYAQGLLRALRELGVLLYMGRAEDRVLRVHEGEPASVRTRGGARLRATDVVVATRAPVGLPRWSGGRRTPPDGLPRIGRLEEGSRVYLATCGAGMGVLQGTIAGLLLADLVQGRGNPWAEVYDPRRDAPRVPPAAAASRAPGELSDPLGDGADIAPGSGAVLRRGLQKVAVYRDWSGRVHVLSAVCSRLAGDRGDETLDAA